MAVAYGTVTQPDLLSQQYPPPLLPKPGKDNVRLQKLIKRTAKKKASAQASQSATPFRSSLSPVNEASPDLEHSDHFTPPRTPETPQSFYSNQQPPRFTIKPLYQHVASPYPQRAAYGRPARMSPQTVAMPAYTYSQHVTTVSFYPASAHRSGVSAALGQIPQLGAPKVLLPASEATASSTLAETHAGLRSGKAAATTSPTPYPTAGVQAVIRPLTVLTPLVKPRSPRPTFKATEPSRSPKPMFDVPQIRMYTASTSFYETSRTPPVYDTAGLTAIGGIVPQSKTPMETYQDLTPPVDVRRGIAPAIQTPLLGADPQRKTPTSDIKRGTTPTGEINATITPPSEIKRATPTAEIKRVTPTAEIKRVTPTAEIKRVTPTAEIKRATPTSEVRRVTPTAEIKRVTPTAEIKRATPTSEVRRVTPTAELKRTTPTAEIRVRTPTYEFQTSRTSAGRPKTPAYHVTRATTPSFEISRPNPLLFAVSPVTVEPERSKTAQTVSVVNSSSALQSVKTTEPHGQILNGDIHSDMTPSIKPIQPSITKSKSEPELSSRKVSTVPVGSEEPKSPISPAVSGYQRSKTPTYEASRLMTTSPGYKRPKTPTYGASPSGFQRPKTPTQVSQKPKSTYRGLTPAEYTAYGGIKTYAPAFGISSLMMPTQEEVKDKKEVSEDSKTPNQERSVKGQSTFEMSTVNETLKAEAKPYQLHEEVATPSIPVIVVTQASDSLAQDMTMVSGQVAAKRETIIQETLKAKPPAEEVKFSEQQKTVTLIQETKPKTPETKSPLPKGGDRDPLKAVKKLLGKDKVQTAEQKSIPKTRADVAEEKEPADVTEIKLEGSKQSSVALSLPVKVPAVAEDRGQDRKAELPSGVQPVPETKEGDENLPGAEPLLKTLLKPKGAKSKTSGWSRLKKHMVVEQEEPKFPEMGSEKEVKEQDQREIKMTDEKAEDKPSAKNENQSKDTPKATKMWDAVLFQMFSSKENIMHQIELNKSEKEKKDDKRDELQEIPSFAYRLPVLLFSPKFDAKKLKEAASRPVTKISTVFEMGLIGRKGKDEEPKDFNRTAKGFTAT